MSKRPEIGSHTWVWSLKKDAVVKELQKYRVTPEPTAKLAELRLLLRTELNKTRSANACRAGRYDQLLLDLDRSEAELDRLEDPDEGLQDEDDEDQGETDDPPTWRDQDREAALRAEIEREERERFEREERERIERENQEAAERERREAAQRAEQELRERLRGEIRARLLREREDQRAIEARQNAEEEQLRAEAQQRAQEEQNLRERLREEIRAQILREEGARRNPRLGHETVDGTPNRPGSSPQNTPVRRSLPPLNTVDDVTELRRRDMVRKWGVTFKGERDVLDFLERLEELADSYGYDMDQLVPCIPILLRDKALLWYRNNKRDWGSWEDFVADLKAFYLPPGLELELEEQIRNRVQGASEAAAEYATRIQTLMRRHGQMSDSARLTRIYFNLRPEYRRYMKRSEFSSVPELLRLAGEYEQLVAQENPAPAKDTKATARRPTRSADTAPLQVFEYNWLDCCWRCRQKGHTKAQCTNKWVKFCMRCGKLDTFSRDCPCPRQGNPERSSPRSQNWSATPQGAPNKTPNTAPKSPGTTASGSNQPQ